MDLLEKNLQMLHRARVVKTNPDLVKYLDIILEVIGQQKDAGRKTDLVAQLVTQPTKRFDAQFW